MGRRGDTSDFEDRLGQTIFYLTNWTFRMGFCDFSLNLTNVCDDLWHLGIPTTAPLQPAPQEVVQ